MKIFLLAIVLSGCTPWSKTEHSSFVLEVTTRLYCQNPKDFFIEIRGEEPLNMFQDLD